MTQPERLRALFLAAVVVTSAFVGSIALAGTAAAGHQGGSMNGTISTSPPALNAEENTSLEVTVVDGDWNHTANATDSLVVGVTSSVGDGVYEDGTSIDVREGVNTSVNFTSVNIGLVLDGDEDGQVNITKNDDDEELYFDDGGTNDQVRLEANANGTYTLNFTSGEFTPGEDSIEFNEVVAPMETLELSEAGNDTFNGSIATSVAAATPGDGMLNTEDGATLTAHYDDLSASQIRTASSMVNNSLLATWELAQNQTSYQIASGESAQITGAVTNTGNIDGTAQVNLSMEYVAVDTVSVDVAPGETETFQFTVDSNDYSPGTWNYELWIDDPDGNATVSGTLEITGSSNTTTTPGGSNTTTTGTSGTTNGTMTGTTTGTGMGTDTTAGGGMGTDTTAGGGMGTDTTGGNGAGTTENPGGPGFTAALGVIALVGAALLATRRN